MLGYITSLNTSSYINLGSWLLKINEQDIIENKDFSDVLIPEFNGSIMNSGNIVENVVSANTINPGGIGSITLNIDYTNVTTPFKYVITLSQNSTQPLSDFKFLNYKINDTLHEFNSENSNISNTITPDGKKTQEEIEICIIWNDDANSQTMNDNKDTAFSHDVSNISYNVNINFDQIVP